MGGSQGRETGDRRTLLHGQYMNILQIINTRRCLTVEWAVAVHECN